MVLSQNTYSICAVMKTLWLSMKAGDTGGSGWTLSWLQMLLTAVQPVVIHSTEYTSC